MLHVWNKILDGLLILEIAKWKKQGDETKKKINEIKKWISSIIDGHLFEVGFDVRPQTKKY